MVMFVTFILICFSMWSPTLGTVNSGIKCDAYELVQYRVTFIGDWSEEKFPKQYPKFRPHAQWSKLIGRSHNDEYNLWAPEKLATSSFKKFAQEASSDNLDKRETQGFNGVLDTFFAPAINAGVGETAVDIFVSAAVRLIPSPDWFVGVNGVQLCANGSWIYETTISLDPVDAGTDRGYTFTSPKWASRPRQRMHQITSKFPNHRANSFYYPELDELPHIAFMKFELLKSNKVHKTHRQVNHLRRVPPDSDEVDLEKKREELEEQQILNGEPLVPNTGGDIEERPGRPVIPQQESALIRKPPSAAAVRLRPSTTARIQITPPPTRPPVPNLDDDEDDDVDDDEILTTPVPITRRLIKTTPRTRTTDNNRLAADQSRPDKTNAYVKPINGQTLQKAHHRVHHKKGKTDENRDCIVGEWGPWSACSKTCGFGAQKRHRKVTQPPKNGRSCPILKQEKWCGSMRNCRDEQKLFSWLQPENSRRGRA